jgi:prepilin-type N-terminal cleavage/methylation domain-containing protein
VLYRDKHQGGLTLLELLVVITILAMVTATVITRLGNTVGPAALGQGISQWKFADEQLRMRARRSGNPAAMQCDIGTNALKCVFNPDDAEHPTFRTLGRGVHVHRIIFPTQEIAYGPATIHYTDRGTSESFAIEFAGHGDTRRWFLVAGVTGQITEVKSESAVRVLLESLIPRGIHAG